MPKNKTTDVRLWDKLVGYAYWDEKRRCAIFQYDKSFLDKGLDVSPVTMPLSNRNYSFDSLNRDTFYGLPGLLADSLPDMYGHTLIDLWIAGKNIPKTEFSPLDRLCYVGKRGMGALEYQPSIGRERTDGAIEVDELASLASEILYNRENFRADLNEKGLRELINVGTSAGGARAKAVVGLNESTGDIRSGQLDLPKGFTHWIIKFDTEVEKKRGYCRIEHAYYEMAKACGINMSESKLLDTGERVHFMTKRFDRVGGERVHMQTLCGLAHYDNRVPGRYSYEDLFALMRLLIMSKEDQEQAFRRMAFNVIMENRDDHTKNISFLMGKDGKWRLSPAYDVTYAFSPDNIWISKHQMSIRGKVENITREDLMLFAEGNGIKGADDIIETILNTASQWKIYAKESMVPEGMVEKIGKRLELFDK
ncbi:MAG: type II toxin-antitoxin system HipA family toxin [Methanomassiliicoccaceae archaeon]|nr:type II toxin-antitoxin system HipA family toxin [Methanomassiliicoccaceae archaeon]